MEEEKRRIYTIVALVALASILFSCIAGAITGGLTGYFVGRYQGIAAAESALERGLSSLDTPRLWQEIPSVPWPDLEEIWPPSELPADMSGALIREVIIDTPADQAGLTEGDIISAIDRTPVDADHNLADVLAQYKPGDRVTIRFWRAGSEESVRVILAEHPDYAGQAYLGIYFQMIHTRTLEAPKD